MPSPVFKLRQFVIATLVTSIWVNVSEVFRYFVFVMPATKIYFKHETGIAEMSWPIFAIWGCWDTLLTGLIVFMFWMYSRLYGNNVRSIFITGTLSWAFIFVIFWVATANMGLADWSMLLITLPLSWIEMVVASWIASRWL